MRVLIVEDEPNLADAIATGLCAEGFDVDVSNDGVDGLWRAREGQFDAIVLDILLPGINGYRICATLRGEGVQTPILMLTAKDGEYDEAEGLDTGADDYVTKPFSFVVLVARLRALIRRGETVRPPTLAIGDLTLDTATKTCKRGDVAVPLTAREYALLEALMSGSEVVHSKQELIDRVWGLDYFGSPNILEVYIGYLRNKIDRPFGVNTIETIRGLGYRATP